MALLNQTFFEKLSSAPTLLLQHRDLLVLESRIVFTALACIYIASYGALRRPPSAKLPSKGKDGKDKEAHERDDQYVQGLLPSDAIMFPVLAGTVLVGLYYLIKWLENTEILNNIIKLYFSTMAIASLGKLFADGLQNLTGFVFPTVWASTDGKIYHIDAEKKGHWYAKAGSDDQVWDDDMVSPLPGIFSKLKFSENTTAKLWRARRILLEDWMVRFTLPPWFKEKFNLKFHDLSGYVLALGVVVLYHTIESPFLSNLIGYALSYVAIMVMSPTTFATGSAVLFGLFFYDIFMVFYTPFMVTVATELDAPIKLVFEGPNGASMLGLGDIVIPGMFIGLCLRFDHYMYYYRQRKLEEIELKTDDTSSGWLITSKEMQRIVVKPEYVNPQGQWGDRFWATTLGKILSPDATPALKASTFPKPYFRAALAGYLVAMVVTLAMLVAFKHAQPALLYLVPGVVIAVWVTGAMRGELQDMWRYTEDGSLDTTDVIVEVDGSGNVIKEVQTKKDEGGENGKQGEQNADDGKQGEQSADDGKAEDKTVFLLSIEAPLPSQ
ncbi:signal peptide peptidase-domain-containing protein [Xylaria palmicola]|nr:signal peptide peptidase-domain-containing protein [Xylaria palmicola]